MTYLHGSPRSVGLDQGQREALEALEKRGPGALSDWDKGQAQALRLFGSEHEQQRVDRLLQDSAKVAAKRPLDSRRTRACTALLAGATREDAAAAAGVSARTLRRWQTEPVFAAEYRKRAREIASGATADLLAATGEAVQALRAALRAAPPTATSVRAARSLLELSLKVLEDDAHRRLDELEGRISRWEDTPTLRSV